MREQVQTKAAVTVSEMARMVGLSRARFYQLMRAGTFPQPDRDSDTGRPRFSEEGQRICLEVRRRNCGVDGRPVLFYARAHPPAAPTRSPRTTSAKPANTTGHADLLDGLVALGLASATADQVDAALKALYPTGTDNVDRADLLREVFLFLKRQNPAGNVGR
jgi:hypothetical protein